MPLWRFAAKTLPNAKFIAIPRPRKKNAAMTAPKGGVQTIVTKPIVVSVCPMINVLDLRRISVSFSVRGPIYNRFTQFMRHSMPISELRDEIPKFGQCIMIRETLV